MNPKTILVPFGGQDAEMGALHTALDLAETYSSHVEVWHVSPDPNDLFMMYAYPGINMPYYDEVAVKKLEKQYEANRNEVREKYTKIIVSKGIQNVEKQKKVIGASASFHTATGNVADIIGLRGRLADLIVLNRTPKKADSFFSEVVDSCLFQTGRPTLLVPPGKAARKFNGKVVIAWNGSVEAARAVAFAMSFLEKRKVWVVTALTDEVMDFKLPPEDLAIQLERHGIETKTLWPDTKKSNADQTILDTAKSLDAGMIVMGAYTHSRIREIIMGGMTKYMLKNADIPIFMAH